MAQPSYSDALVAIYQAALQPELWPETLELISDFLGADSGMVLHLSAHSDFIIHRRLREDLNRRFLQHHTKNPYAFAFARAPIGKALVTEAVIERKQLYRSAFYTDILAPQRIAEIVAVRHSDLSRAGAGGILFNFSNCRTNDVDHAASRLDDLVSHLTRAVDCTLLTSRLKAGQRQLEDVLANAAGAVVLLDCHGKILQATTAAEALLGECDGLVAKKGGSPALGAQMHDDFLRLTTSIKRALAVAQGEPRRLEGTLQIKRPSGRRALLVQVIPLPVEAFTPWGTLDGGARVMLRIVDPHASIDTQAERLRLLFGLTAAETRVAALLGSGLGLIQSARALGVSLNTVKTHTSRVFDKTGVRSSAALVRLVASLPSGPAPDTTGS